MRLKANYHTHTTFCDGADTPEEVVKEALRLGMTHLGFSGHMDADICVFDPDKIMDRADYTDPSGHAEGLSYVIVGGKVAAINAVATGELGGKVMYRQTKI